MLVCQTLTVQSKENYFVINALHIILNKWAASWQNQQSECAPSEDSDQPSLIRVFSVHSMGRKGPKLSSRGQRRLWSDWADAQADLSLRWAHNHIFFSFFFHETVQMTIDETTIRYEYPLNKRTRQLRVFPVKTGIMHLCLTSNTYHSCFH